MSQMWVPPALPCLPAPSCTRPWPSGVLFISESSFKTKPSLGLQKNSEAHTELPRPTAGSSAPSHEQCSEAVAAAPTQVAQVPVYYPFQDPPPGAET